MVKFKDYSRPLKVFQALFKAKLFSKTFQDSPEYSSTFQACANPGISSNQYLQHDFSGGKNSTFDPTLNYGKNFSNISLILFPSIISFVVCPFIYLCSLEAYIANTTSLDKQNF